MIGSTKVEGSDAARRLNATATGVKWFMTELILVIMVIYVTLVYGSIAAFLWRCSRLIYRYTSMSLPYHIGLPTSSTAG